MNILVTGAAGFLGKNLVENLKNIRDGKNRTRPMIKIDKIYEYDRQNNVEDLNRFCCDCDFVFNLAGINRPDKIEEFNEGNFVFASNLLELLKNNNNKCPVMLASSQQASLAGRFGTSDYGLSKKAGEELFFKYASETGAKVFIYRFPNLAGKWIKPNYNSAIGTFCNNIANDLPVTVNDPNTLIELLFIDDLLEEMYDLLEGKPKCCNYPNVGEVIDGVEYDGLTPQWCKEGKYCAAKGTYKVTLGYVVKCLKHFHDQPKTLLMPRMAPNSFEKKLYSMYLSYLPLDKIVYDLDMKSDERGSFTEILKTPEYGQFSVNVTKPSITKGQHWHNSKWELFIVVSGHGLIQERKIGINPETGKPFDTFEIEVSGDRIQAVHMIPGCTHNIINLSDSEDLITLMWANEVFNEKRPDTFYEVV